MSLSTADSTTVQEAIRGRRTCARFRSEPLPEALLGELLEAARWAPSADNSQPWYLIVIRDPSTKRRLNAVAAESLGHLAEAHAPPVAQPVQCPVQGRLVGADEVAQQVDLAAGEGPRRIHARSERRLSLPEDCSAR